MSVGCNSTELRRTQEALRDSEIRRQALLDYALDCIICANDKVIITDFNPAAERTFQVSRSEAVGEDLPGRIFPPRLRERLRAGLFICSVAGDIEVIGNRTETTCLRGDGSEFPAEITVTQVIVDKQTSYVVYVRDITARRMAEEQLLRLAGIVESSRDAIIGKDLTGRITSWNKGAEAMYGYPAHEAISRNIRMLAPAERVDEIAWILQCVKEGQSIQGFETVRMTKTGKPVWVSLTVSPVLDSNAIVVGASTIARDITEQKLVEEALRKANETSIYTSPIPIVAADTDGRITMWNPAAETLFGWSEHEVVGKQNPTIRWEGVQESADLRARLLSGQVLSGVEMQRQRRDGSVLEVNLSAAPIKDAKGQIKGVLGFFTDVTEQKQSQEALRIAEQKYRTIFENAVEGIYQRTASGSYLSANPALARMLGFESAEELIPIRTDVTIQKHVNPELYGEFVRAMEEKGSVENFEHQAYRKDGKMIWVSENAHVVRDSMGNILYFEGTIQDITHRRELEQQLQQMQKIEAVGRLAGGVAHDFNNILMAISSYAELLERKVSDDGSRRYLNEIVKATDRASSLTQGLLTFSREQILSPKLLDLNAVIREQVTMLQRLIPENIELQFLPGESIGAIKADQIQIEQVVMNLVINARDAMPNGGRLVIETSNAVLDEVNCVLPSPAPMKDFVAIVVTDNGCGMTVDTKSRMFEPFYTTKEKGKGTGLGLAIVFGVVKQNGGQISVYSELGLGTTFRIYFPLVAREFEQRDRRDEGIRMCGTETVLLVEDEESVRESTAEYLTESGYTVLKAKGGPDALQVAEQYCGTIHLLLTDLIMPQMSGRELSERVRKARPELRVVFISGYSNHMLSTEQVLDPQHVLLQKPFRLDALGKSVREALSSSSSAAAGK
jgi:two-component system, cell cycle sensor histidine kinase and response regulator CckA